jgi:SAM-dependent methyltransferase
MMSLGMRRGLRRAVRSAIPLPLRMRLAIWLNRQRWFTNDYLAKGLVGDLGLRDPQAFHKFLWKHHFMGYARWYDSENELFSADRMQPSRRMLFDDLESVLRQLGLQRSDIGSILEVGCSLGYLLRHLETDVFPECREFMGLDIDEPAIRKGTEYLKQQGSKVVLAHGDMEELDCILGSRTFDLVFAAGVLSYLDEANAARVVSMLLKRTNKVLALAGLACGGRDNRELEASESSPNHERQWIHNFEAMVSAAGGRAVMSRWEGAKLFNLQTIHFVFAVPT